MSGYLSAFIITFNEEADLPDCLASIRAIADEIIVVDQGSTDGTRRIAERAGAHVIHRPFDGFGAQKQAALDACTGEWVLSIDADERLTPELATAITAAIRDPQADGYLVHRIIYYLGRRLRYGGTGNEWLLRLARRERAHFTAATVHERLVVDGAVRKLPGTLLHMTYRDLSDHLNVINRYTDEIAAGKAREGNQFHMIHLVRIPFELLSRLVVKLGVLDGRAGIIWGAMAAYYGFLKYAKLYRAHRPPAAQAQLEDPTRQSTAARRP